MGERDVVKFPNAQVSEAEQLRRIKAEAERLANLSAVVRTNRKHRVTKAKYPRQPGAIQRRDHAQQNCRRPRQDEPSCRRAGARESAVWAARNKIAITPEFCDDVTVALRASLGAHLIALTGPRERWADERKYYEELAEFYSQLIEDLQQWQSWRRRSLPWVQYADPRFKDLPTLIPPAVIATALTKALASFGTTDFSHLAYPEWLAIVITDINRLAEIARRYADLCIGDKGGANQQYPAFDILVQGLKEAS